jgi:hypothetical protein
MNKTDLKDIILNSTRPDLAEPCRDDQAPPTRFPCEFSPIAHARGLAGTVICAALIFGGWVAQAASVFVPNASFESPAVPPVSPYAWPFIDDWQKSAQPVWYNPTNNNNTPWDYLMGTFYNVPFPGVFIDNCDGSDAAFLFAVPDAALFQDYDSVYGTNTTPTHAFNAKFNVGSSYDLTVGLIGGGGGMTNGVTLDLSLYYRDSSSNMVTVATTTVTNSLQAFPTTTNFVDFQVHVPAVKAADAWAGQHIGIQLLSTANFGNAGGYWDLDNVRLRETPALALSSAETMNGLFSFTVVSQPGVQFEIQASTDTAAASGNWVTLATITNATGVTPFTDSMTNSIRYYRARQL